MNNLDKLIYRNTKSEKWHLSHPNALSPFYNSLHTKNYHGNKVFFFDFINTLKTHNIGMIKESRYTIIPPHLHKDMEMNYVYSGSCTFLINKKRITLKQGDVCILDTDVINSVEYKGENDIVFNIIFKKDFFSSTFLSQFSASDTLGKFLLNAIIGQQIKNNFLIFHTHQSKKFKQIFHLILEEHYFPKSNSLQLIENYCSILFFYLSRLIKKDKDNIIFSTKNKNALMILQEIEKLDGNCSLNSLSQTFHLSTSSIYKLLKNSTGKAFSEIKLEAQLKKACLLLTETSLPILEIAENVGIKNMTFFYKKFESFLGVTPKNYRINNQNLQI
ncbi:AraC family transcriptional regulator [Lactobacillus sp. ESL0731]|uniref:AraC family transcriptional regulator n=1 Tax=unclassified Lactobacillus TaxID=2620435 RepID=UPI0023FA20A3|nr:MULTISPECIES: AraC family transcriptional regulator [unclassified Lactobacillus]WEV51471.1 AraC family transcriptional regulator [Lactobacillus sp. ESL0700]WEV62600.1 AraC family transcriptional regulator [Lactobacillus sp. ESL0731]